MRLIDADALENVMDDRYSLGEIGRRERDDIVNALNYCAPTVDAVAWEWLERYAQGMRMNYASEWVAAAKEMYKSL